MLVYTEEFVEKIKKEDDNNPNFNKIALYSLLTMDKYKSMRNEIEEWVSDLTKEKQEKVIKKLHMENYNDTYNELVVGNILKNLGFEIDYEAEIDGKTPDWYVSPKGEIPAFMVEVLTKNYSEKYKKLKYIRYFLDQLETIPHGVALIVNFINNKIYFNKGTVNNILKKVQDWLIKCNQQVGEKFEHNGITFKISPFNEPITHVIPIGIGIHGFKDIKAMKNTIRNKIRTYRELAEKEKKPFVISVFDDSLIRFGFEDLRELLFNSRGGFFPKESILSYVIWVYKELDEWKVKSIENLNAINKLPSNTFS